jgi:tetratricopeptide (TPR) repeat protein
MAAGHLYAEDKKFDQAISCYNSALKINPSRAQTYQELGSCYSEQKNYAKAEENFLKALSCSDSTSEKNALTYYNLSSVMYAQNKKSDALDYAKKAYENRGQTEKSVKANIDYNYGLLMQETGDENSAADLYRETLSLDANHVKANVNLGKILLSQNKNDEAITVLLRAYKVEPKNFEVNNNLGSAYRNTKDFASSVKFYKNALAIDGGNSTVKENLARSYAASADYANARTLYEELVKSKSDNWDWFLELSRVCISQGDSESAEKYLLYLQSRAPNFKKAEVEQLLSQL